MHSRQAQRIVVEGLRPGAGGEQASRLRRGDVDWPAALALANEHFVAPALYASLSGADRLQDLPSEVRDYLALLHGQNAKRNGRLREQAEELIGALNIVGVEPMLLKGGLALFLEHYPDPAARIIRDLDLLVAFSEADRVLQVFRSLGYRAIARYPDGYHAYGDFARAGDPGAIDLHFELIDADYVMPASLVWGRARRVDLPGAKLLVPSPADCVLHALLHAQVHQVGQHYQGRIELRQLHDFVMLARHHEAEIDWPSIARHLARHRLEGALQSYLLAAEQLLGMPWPLAEPPTVAARLQLQRCLVQMRLPFLAELVLPLGNLCAAFAAHRMNGLYDTREPLASRRLRHAAQFMRKSSRGALMKRLFFRGG